MVSHSTDDIKGLGVAGVRGAPGWFAGVGYAGVGGRAGGDGLALDLQFATDKTLTARKGPTPTFTRASSGTFVGSDGRVRLADMNLSLYSGAMVNGTGWTTTQTTSTISGSGPDGNAAYRIAEVAINSQHQLNNTGGTGTAGATSVVSGTVYTGSIFLKKDEGGVDWIQLTLGLGGFGSAQYANFNISNGTVGNFSGLASGTSPLIEDYGNGWYRCSMSVTATATVSNSLNVVLAFTNNTNGTTRAPGYVGNTSNSILVAMCQFEQGSSARTYNPTTNAVYNGPRFDHDPVTLASRGLLIEESRTNIALRSGAIVFGSGWFIDNATSTSSGTGPDGNTSYLITESTGTSSHTILNSGGLSQAGATSVTNGTVYTGSIFIKKVAGSVDWVQLSFGSAGFGAAQYANFNIGNGTVGNSAGLASGTSPRIEDYGNGWYRCSISVAATATTSTSGNVIVAFTNNTNNTTRLPSYTGSASNSVFASMVQFEAGSFATSYIPTTATSVVRSADVCSISGSGFTGMWNALEGSLFTSAIFNAPVAYGASQMLVDINDGTAANRLRYARNLSSGTPVLANTSGNTLNAAINGATALQQFVVQKYSSGFKLDDYVLYTNNVQIGTDNLGAMIVSPTTMTIGDTAAGVIRATTNGTISAIRYYKKRLPNAKLQAITV